jgi:hypothetical protein
MDRILGKIFLANIKKLFKNTKKCDLGLKQFLFPLVLRLRGTLPSLIMYQSNFFKETLIFKHNYQ